MHTPYEIMELVKKLYPTVKLHVYINISNTQFVTIDIINIPRELQGQGIGTWIMEHLIVYADESDKVLILSPEKLDSSTRIVRLRKWYLSFGFVWNKGRNKSFMTKESMYRKPKTRCARL